MITKLDKEKYVRFLVILMFSILILSSCYFFFKKFYLFKSCTRFTIGTVVKSTRDYSSSTSTITIAIKYKGKEYLIDGGDGGAYPNGTKFLVKFACDDPYINETYTQRRIKGDSLNIPDEGWEKKPYQF